MVGLKNIRKVGLMTALVAGLYACSKEAPAPPPAPAPAPEPVVEVAPEPVEEPFVVGAYLPVPQIVLEELPPQPGINKIYIADAVPKVFEDSLESRLGSETCFEDRQGPGCTYVIRTTENGYAQAPVGLEERKVVIDGLERTIYVLSSK